MSARRLRALAVSLAGLVVAGGLSVVATPAAYALDAPANPAPAGSQVGIPVFTWDRVPGAVSYDFQVSASDQFTGNLVNVTTVQRQYAPKIQLPTGTQLYWRVRATGVDNTWTDPTAFVRTTVGAPTLTGPADGAQLTQPDNPVTLSWQPVAGAASYDVQYGTDPNFVDQTTSQNVKTSSFVVPLQAPGTYVWRVRAVLGGGVSSAWSGGATPLPPARSYVVKGLANDSGVPPTSPPDDPNQALTDVVLDWEPIKGAKSYQIQIGTDREFPANTIVDQVATVYGTRYSPPKTLNNDQYYWRVRATDSGGFQPEWASRPVWRFKRSWPDQPALLYPVNGAANVKNPFYYQWTPVKHASSYVVQISSGGAFPTPAPFTGTCVTTHTTLVYGDLAGNCWPTQPGTYSWRVTARDQFANVPPVTDGISAPVSTFYFNPELVTTTGPPNGTVVHNTYDDVQTETPTLTWNPVAGADKYKVTISGSSTVQSFTTAALAYTPKDLDEGTYSWDVQTVDALGQLGAGHTSQRTFTVLPPPMIPNPNGSQPPMVIKPVPNPLPTAGPPDPLVADLGSSYRFPAMRWQPVSWVARYELYVSRGANPFTRVAGDFEWAAGDDLTTTNLNPGSYRWYVKAVRKDGTSLTGSVGTFQILSLPDIPVESYRAALSGNALTGNAGAQIDTCDLKLPSNCQNLRSTPVIGWESPDPNVGHYIEVLSRDAELTNMINSKTIVNTMYLDRDALPDSQAGAAYFTVILPCVVDTICRGLTHSTHSFNKLTRPATLVSPAHGATVQNDVTLTWDDYLDSQTVVESQLDPDTSTPLDEPGQVGASFYNVQTASDQNFTQNVTTTQVDQTTFTSFADTYPEGTTWWRVQAVDRNGNTMAWSTPRSFLKQSPVPVLSLPADNATVPGDYALSWEALPFAASYDVEVYKNGDTSGNTANRVVNVTTDRVQYVLTNLDPGAGPYKWRVRRKDGRVRPGQWSDYRTFSVSRPGVPLISPVDGDTTVPPSDQLFTWQDVPGATSYKFERRVAGSGSVTETVDTPTTKWAPQLSIAGGNWQWRVTAYDPANNLIADSGWAHPFSVTDTPVATVAVSISGSGVVDSTLTLNPAQWNMSNSDLSITYQWYRSGSAVAGATGETYEVTALDVGKAITVRATATRPGYKTGTSTSNTITGAQAGAPLPAIPVTINGSGLHGSTLQLDPPEWDVAGVATTYQWFRDTAAIGGQTGTSYTVVTADMGKAITVRATGTKAGYANGTSVSNAVTAALNPAPAASPPAAITGSGDFGSNLTLTEPGWDTAGVTTTIEWYRDTTKISGQSGLTYTVVQADLGKSISVKVVAKKTGYVDGLSVSNAIVAKPAAALVSTSSPVITGTPAARETLTADPGNWPSGSTFTYQWFVNGQAVARETNAKYVVRTRDAGLPVKVRVTANKVGYLPGEAYSNQLAVKKLVTTTTATLVSSTIPKRGRGVLNVHVEVLDLGVPLGKLQILDGKKVVGTAQLKNNSGGNMQIRLKKLAPGKHKLTVVYLGSASTSSSKSKKLKLVVLKK